MFKAELTPYQMLKLGVFGGSYFTKNLHTLPQTWLKGSHVSDTFDVALNAFKVRSGQSLEVWIANGWINRQDPLGWFQWYCRYYVGRRSPDDKRQISRWVSYKRHSSQCLNAKGDTSKRLAQRQSLLQWGYDPFPDCEFLGKETVFQKSKRLLQI